MKARQRVYSALAMIAVLGVILLSGGTVIIASWLTSPAYPATPHHNLQAEQSFRETIAQGADLNSGLTIVRLRLGSAVGEPTPPPTNVGLMVLNHTNESVVFINQGFGMKVLSFDLPSAKWQEVNLPTRPLEIQTTLPPKLLDYDLTINNTWHEDLRGLDYPTARIYVVGQGATTGNIYGAYLDVTLSPSDP